MFSFFNRIFSVVLVFSLILSCSPKIKLVNKETSYSPLSSAIVVDSAVYALILPYKDSLEAEMSVVLNSSAQPLIKGLPESLLGNYVADGVLKKTNDKYKPADGVKAHFCLLNNGGLRTSLPEGEITRGKVYELMPFENEMLVLTLSGSKTYQLFKFIAANNGMPLSGAQLGIKTKKPESIYIAGEPFDSLRTYKVATSDYLANGGDKMSFFNEPISVDTIHYKVRDAIIDYIVEERAQGKLIEAKLDRRIYEQ